MGTRAVIGAQWGDEGKGKVVDLYAEKASTTVRYSGGPNAGHTLFINGIKYLLRNLPVGIVRPDTWNVVGPYAVCDPEVITDELKLAKSCGSNVMLDNGAPVILPIHKIIDGLREDASGDSAIGTTRKGIGPCYEDWIARRGIVLGNLRNSWLIRSALEARGYYAERAAVVRHYGGTCPSLEETVAWLTERSASIVPHLGDTREFVASQMVQGKDVLFEGAQGVMLDIVHGGRPYCTSSFCGSGSIQASMGVYNLDHITGVTKAYATRVGAGPFPTECPDSIGDRLRERGKEFGSVTSRPRRCGWLDLPALRYACRVGGITELIITKLDVLTGMTINVATTYRLDEDLYEPLRARSSLTTPVLSAGVPTYKTLPGWTEDIRNCRVFDQLPAPARTYIEFIRDNVGLPIVGVSVGPDRNDMIWMK